VFYLINWNIYAYSEVKSTNLLAEEIFDRLDPLAVLIADIQTEGKGYGVNTWDSPLGGLWASFVMKAQDCPPISCPKSLFSIVTALAACDTLASFGVTNLKIKWPNDIVHESEMGFGKLGGVLTNIKYLGNEMEGAIIGVGMNLTSKANYSESTPNYFCLDQLNVHKTPEEVLDVLIIQLTKCLWKTSTIELLNDINALIYRNKVYWGDVKEEKIKVEIKSINEQGELVITKENETFVVKEEQRHLLHYTWLGSI